jgi:hypothetical protein
MLKIKNWLLGLKIMQGRVFLLLGCNGKIILGRREKKLDHNFLDIVA